MRKFTRTLDSVASRLLPMSARDPTELVSNLRLIVREFSSGREAKEYLIAKIVNEAGRNCVPLSETERKMMYYTETAWTLPDMQEVSDRFDHECDQAEYERKMGRLANSARNQAKIMNEADSWKEATRILDKEDHYLCVLISASSASSNSYLIDRLKLIGTALLLCLLILTGIVLYSSRT